MTPKQRHKQREKNRAKLREKLKQSNRKKHITQAAAVGTSPVTSPVTAPIFQERLVNEGDGQKKVVSLTGRTKQPIMLNILKPPQPAFTIVDVKVNG